MKIKVIFVETELLEKGNEEDYYDYKYINEINEQEKLELIGKKLIAIDPNMGDLIYCIDTDDKKNHSTFRYTNIQRKYELKYRRYSFIRNKVERDFKFNDQSLKLLQLNMSNYNSKTVDFDKFKLIFC